MKYVKYTGYNGFQVYGFVKDNTHKLDMWRVRIKKTLRLFSTKVNRELYVSKGNYVYVDDSEQYYLKIKVAKYNPCFLLLYKKSIKFFRNLFNSRIKKNINILENLIEK